MRVFLRLMVAHYKQFIREKAALFWTFAFPVFFILIFGAVFSGGHDITFSVGLAVEDESSVAQNLSGMLQQVDAFELTVGDRDSELQALRDGDRRAVLVIESGFGAAIFNQETANISVYYDPDPTQASYTQTLLSVVHQIIDEFDQTLSGYTPLIQLNEKKADEDILRSNDAIDYLVPGILAMAIMQLGIFAAVDIVIERENRVLKRLGATPLKRSTMILSTVGFRLIVAVLQAALIILVARLVFGVPMLGNWFALVGFVLLGTLTFLAMGYMLSAFAKTERTAMPLMMSIQFPMMFLSGIFFPVEMMPDFMRPIMDAMPLTYLGDAFRQIMVESTPLHSQVINLGVLAGWLIVCLIVAVRFFRWE